MDDAHGDGLNALAGLASAPGFGFVEFLLLLVEGFFDVLSQAAAFVEGSGGKGHLVGEGDVNFVAVRATGGDPAPDNGGVVEVEVLIADDQSVNGMSLGQPCVQR